MRNVLIHITAVDSAEAQLLRAQLQERDRQLEKLEVM